MNKEASFQIVKGADAVAYRRFKDILQDAFKVDGFRGVIQVCDAVAGAYDAALAVCEEHGLSDDMSLAVAATQLNRGVLSELGRAVGACVGKKEMS